MCVFEVSAAFQLLKVKTYLAYLNVVLLSLFLIDLISLIVASNEITE